MTDDVTPERIRAAAQTWRQLAEAATSAPWEMDQWHDLHGPNGDNLCGSLEGDGCMTVPADAALIAAARAPLATVAAMLDEIADEHYPLRPGYAASICSRCGQDGGLLVTYPCPTVRAVWPWVQAVER